MKMKETVATLELKPPLKWAGGKRWLVPHLQVLWTPSARLVEPLCGGLAVTLGLQPETALLNDINPHPINFYRWVQRGLETSVPMRNDEELFYSHRARFNKLVAEGKQETREAAELFYYLNRTCFNGLCRFNRSGEFNVPFGRYKRINYARDFRHYKETFSQFTFTCVDFENVTLRRGDFVYADPPYDVEFTQYAKQGFDWEDQVRLADWLSEHDGPVVISNQATERIVDLYRGAGFALRFLDGPRRISCTGDRTPAKEVLATKGLQNA